MYPSTPMQYNKYKIILEQVSHPQEATVNARNETTKSTTTLDYYNKNAKKFITGTISVDFGTIQNHFLDKLYPGAESWITAAVPAATQNISWGKVQSHSHRRFTGTMQTCKRIYRHSGKAHAVPGTE